MCDAEDKAVAIAEVLVENEINFTFTVVETGTHAELLDKLYSKYGWKNGDRIRFCEMDGLRLLEPMTA